jgi:hypothetical protein
MRTIADIALVLKQGFIIRRMIKTGTGFDTQYMVSPGAPPDWTGERWTYKEEEARLFTESEAKPYLNSQRCLIPAQRPEVAA